LNIQTKEIKLGLLIGKTAARIESRGICI
jgi:hypothetical protein